MQSTNIIAKRTGNFFAVTLNIGKQVLSVKFDTGACNTVISAEVLYGELDNKRKECFKRYCKQRGVIPKPFEVTTGNIMKGFPVLFENVEVNGTAFSQFYCYIIVDIDGNRKGKVKKFALLGDDFLDCCGYSHNPHEDIKIFCFDKEGYSLKGSIMSGQEIDELLSNG